MAESRIAVKVNGEGRELVAGTSVAGLLGGLGIRPAAVVVEINVEIVPREQFATRLLATGDEIEIVHFVGGG